MGRGVGGGLLRDELGNRKTIIGSGVGVNQGLRSIGIMVYIDVCAAAQLGAGR